MEEEFQRWTAKRAKVGELVLELDALTGKPEKAF